jgi:spore coat protein U-like protein
MAKRAWTVGLSLVVALLVSSEVQAACTISTTSVNFGSYNVYASSPTDSTGSVTFKCNFFDFNISVALSQGQSGTYFPRAMRKGGEQLPYNLFRDAGRSSVWGDGTGGTTQYVNNWPFGQTIVLTIYGRVDAGADVSAGNYSDTVSAIINF